MVESPAVYIKMLTSTLRLLGPSHYNYILHDSLNAMLGKTSVSMMVLLAAASLIGISSIHQYLEGQTPPPATTPQPQRTVQLEGRVVGAIMISASRTCTGFIELPIDEPNLLRLPPGTHITLTAPIESCTLFGLAKIGKTPIHFVIPGPAPTAPSSTRDYRVTQVIL